MLAIGKSRAYNPRRSMVWLTHPAQLLADAREVYVPPRAFFISGKHLSGKHFRGQSVEQHTTWEQPSDAAYATGYQVGWSKLWLFINLLPVA